MLSLDQIKSLVYKKLGEVSEHRLEHTLGVVEMAEYLALKYNVDPNKAMVAAYMHDYCKYDDTKNAKDILTSDEIAECEEYPFLYHAYLSAEAYKALGDYDIDIYNAIKYHVFGRPNMSMLEAIIMISDYTEKNRKYESCIECRKILLDGNFNYAIYKSISNTISFCEKEGNKPHPKQIEVLKEYKEKI